MDLHAIYLAGHNVWATGGIYCLGYAGRHPPIATAAVGATARISTVFGRGAAVYTETADRLARIAVCPG